MASHTLVWAGISAILIAAGQPPAEPTLSPDERKQLNTEKQALAKQRRNIANGLNCDGCAGRGVSTKLAGGGAYGKGTTVQVQTKCKDCRGDGLVIDRQLISSLHAYYNERDRLEQKWPGSPIEGRPTLAEWLLRRITTVVTASKFRDATQNDSSLIVSIVEPQTYYDNRQCDFTLAVCAKVLNGKASGGNGVALLFPSGSPPEVGRMLNAKLHPRILVIAYRPTPSRTTGLTSKWKDTMASEPLDPSDERQPTGDSGLWQKTCSSQSSTMHVLACKMVTPSTLKKLRN